MSFFEARLVVWSRNSSIYSWLVRDWDNGLSVVNHRHSLQPHNKPKNIVHRPPHHSCIRRHPHTLPRRLQLTSTRAHKVVSDIVRQRGAIYSPKRSPAAHSTIAFRRQQPAASVEVCFLSVTAQSVIGANAGQQGGPRGTLGYRRPSRTEEITDEKLIPAGQASSRAGTALAGRWPVVTPKCWHLWRVRYTQTTVTIPDLLLSLTVSGRKWRRNYKFEPLLFLCDAPVPGFHHSVAVLSLPFRRSAVVKFRCSVKITQEKSVPLQR